MIWRAPTYETYTHNWHSPNPPVVLPTVTEPDAGTVETGLLDAQGRKLRRTVAKPAIGYALPHREAK